MSSHNFEILKFDSWKSKKIPAQFEVLKESAGGIARVKRNKDSVEFNWGDYVIMDGNKRIGNKLTKYVIHGFDDDMAHVIIRRDKGCCTRVFVNWLAHK